MSKELQRAAIKNILQELSDNALPIQQLVAQSMIEDWDEDKTQRKLGEAIKNLDLTKTFDYYTDRIMSVFEPANLKDTSGGEEV